MLKTHSSIKDIINELRNLKKTSNYRHYKTIAARPPKPSESNDGSEDTDDLGDNVKIVNMRDGNKVQKYQPAKISREYAREIARGNRQLRNLMNQQVAAYNIINQLQHDFKGSKEANVPKLLAMSQQIAANLDTQIANAKSQLATLAKKTSPQALFPFIKKVTNYIQQNLGEKNKYSNLETFSSVAMMDADGKPVINADKVTGDDPSITPMYAVYLVLENLKNDSGIITPELIIAICLWNNQFYINPGLSKILLPGQFRISKAVQQPIDAWKIIDRQLTTLDNVANIRKPIPPQVKDQAEGIANHAKVKSFSVDNDKMTFFLKNVKNEADAQTVANDLYKLIYSAAKSADNRAQFRMQHVISSNKGNYSVTFTFIPGGKFSGRTVSEEWIDNLRKIGLFDSEISQIKHIIESKDKNKK